MREIPEIREIHARDRGGRGRSARDAREMEDGGQEESGRRHLDRVTG